MAVLSAILGESGAGKSRSIKGLEDKDPFIIQVIQKPMPFRTKLKPAGKDGKGNLTGNLFHTTDWITARRAIEKAVAAGRKVIVVDDFQYLLADEFMRRADEKGFAKFTELGQHAYDFITNLANKLPSDVRVYFLTHIDRDETGREKMKTIGKMLDEKVCLEGLFPIVLMVRAKEGKHVISTKTQGMDTVKAPEGMFDDEEIENDLKIVDEAICNYWNLEE